MSENEKSGSGPIDYVTLKKRLCVLAERDRDAVAVFAARCALRVLPFTVRNGGFVFGNRIPHELVQMVFVASVMGFEYLSFDREKLRVAAVYSTNLDATASNSAYAALAAYLENVPNVAAYAASTATHSSYAASGVDAETVEATVSAIKFDLKQLEQVKSISLKNSLLWPEGIPVRVDKNIAQWSEVMLKAGLDRYVLVYSFILEGGDYPEKEVRALIEAWYQRNGKKYERKIFGNTEIKLFPEKFI